MKIPAPIASHCNVVGRDEPGDDPVALFTPSQGRENEHRQVEGSRDLSFM